MGFGILEEKLGRAPKVLQAGVLSPKGDLSMSERLLWLANGLQELFRVFNPQELALENVFGGRNIKSALILGQARGVVMLAAAQSGMSVFEYAPTHVKKAMTGSGGANKEQVRNMVTRLLNLDLGNACLDVSDALSLAVCHLNRRGLALRGII
jgi:crossover junction endodeoxyribonuclease RuvC